MSAHEFEILLGTGLLTLSYLVTCYALPFAIVRRCKR